METNRSKSVLTKYVFTQFKYFLKDVKWLLVVVLLLLIQNIYFFNLYNNYIIDIIIIN